MRAATGCHKITLTGINDHNFLSLSINPPLVIITGDND